MNSVARLFTFSLRTFVLTSSLGITSFLTSPAWAGAACAIQPCFIEQVTDPVTKRPVLKGVACRDDQTDIYYQGRLRSPKPTTARCIPGDQIGTQVNMTMLPVLARAADVGRVAPVCMARALQRSDSVDSTITYCPSENGALDLKRKPTHCPTPRMVNYLTSWVNQAIMCMDPRQQGGRLFPHRQPIDSEILFGILAHESRGNMNAASWAGKGVMQLTTPAVREFYTPLRNGLRSIWTDASTSSSCAPFVEPMNEKISVTVQKRVGRRGRVSTREAVDPDWACKMISPEALPRHLIVAITNLYFCRDQAERVLKSRFNLSRLRSYATSKDKRYKEAQKEEMVHDLIMVCHNWGSGNMNTAVRRIAPRSFKDAAEFRSVLINRGKGGGFSATTHAGVAAFPQMVRSELEALKNGEGQFGQARINRCAQ